MKHTIIVTGSSGYLGSAICVDLARDNRVIGIDTRKPSKALQKAAPNVQWEQVDIADVKSLKMVFSRNKSQKPDIDFVIHFAAYYHYGKDWREEYCRTNIKGTQNIIETAHQFAVRRIIFASSIASLRPPPQGGVLTEESSTDGSIPYSKSKSIGEALLAENASSVPAIALRLGGVFSDWCELPPLYSLMKLWSRSGFIGRLVPGDGKSGFPYIHRYEMAQMVRRVIEMNNYLNRFDILFASEEGCTQHEDLFPIIRRAGGKNLTEKPIHISPSLAMVLLYGNYFLNLLRRKNTYERPWMINYIDHPLVVDTTYTRKKIAWDPMPEYQILARLPVLIHIFNSQRSRWEERNIRRNEGKYEYIGDKWNQEKESLSCRRSAGAARRNFSQKQ